MDQDTFVNGIEITDTTPATASSGSLFTIGGISILNTTNATTTSASFLTLGGSYVQGNSIIGGTVQLLSTTIATNTSTGALTIAGGLSVQGSVYGVYSNFNYIQAGSASIPNIISSNISVGTLLTTTFNSINITCNSITTSNLIATNISTNSLYINTTTSSNIPTIFSYNSNNTTATGLAFSSWNGTQFTEKARFDSIGNFLINTTQPATSNTLYLNSLSTTGSDGATFDTQYAINPVISLAVQGSKKYTIGIDSSDAYKLKFNRGLFSSQFNTITLDQNGNVGINTAIPTSKLQVIGDTNVSGNLTAGTSFYTPSATIGSLNVTNFTTVNSKITNETIGTINMTNLVGINSTITNSIGINLNYTNISVSSLNVPNLNINNLSIGNLVATNMTAVTFLLTGTTNASNIVYIDCQGSQNYPGQLVFKNSFGTGDFRIYGDGGDVQWQGGGGRSLQLGAYHEIRLTGGRVSTAPITFITGSTSTWNTIIQNLNNSIGLVVQGVSGQSVDLTQWSNNSGTVLSRIDYIGNLQITSTSDSISSISGGSITTSGGISVAKSIDVGSTQIAINNSSGGLIVSGGAGFNGDIYSNNFYAYQGTSTASVSLTPSPLTTKGDIYTYATSGSRLPAGTYGQVLTSNTTSNTGLQWVSPINITKSYGSELNYVSVQQTSGTSSNTGTLKTSLTTGTLLGGIYKVEINYSIAPNTSTGQNSEIAVYINTNSLYGFDVGTTTSNLIHQTIYRPSQLSNLLPISQGIIITQGNTILTMGMYYRTQNNNSNTNIGNASLILYRIQ